MPLILYQLEGCPYCARVRAALDAKGLDYESINVERDRGERSALVAVSGQDRVPVLVDGETVVTDSERIVEYVEGTL